MVNHDQTTIWENPRMMMCFSLGKLKVNFSVGHVIFAIVLSLFFCAYCLHVENIPLWFLRVSLVFLVIPSCRACIVLGKAENIWCFISKKLPVYSISRQVFRHRYYGDRSEYEFWLNSDLAFVFGSFRFWEGLQFVGFLKETFSWLRYRFLEFFVRIGRHQLDCVQVYPMC